MSAGLPFPIRPMSEDLPERIGSYPVRGVIGTGSMGVVYLGHDPVIDRPVAIKTIQRHLLDAAASEHNVAARFRVEAQAAGRLNHRNIVSVYQFGADGDFDYIVMEYVPGHSLGDYLRRTERFKPAEVLCLMLQLLSALQYAHENGVVHRDIKPANLMVAGDGRLKITDFGIARTESSQVTRVNAIVGSPGYMAPEQYTGGALDSRVDVFSAGVLLYQLLTGCMPFSGTDEAIMYQIVYEQHQSPVARTGDPSLAPYEPVLARALAKNAAQRYASATEFRNALQALSPVPVAELLPRERLLPVQPVAFGTGTGRAAPGYASGATTQVPGSGATTQVPGSGGGTPGRLGTGSRGPVGPPDDATRPSPSVPSVPSVPVPTGWDETQLHGLERELAQYVGPVAKVLVRRAARGQSDLGAVRRLVAASIADFEIRQRFLGAPAAAPAPVGATRRTTGSFVPTRTVTALSGARLQPGDVDKAASVMVRSVGPIAKVLARQCAARSTTREEFIGHVLAQLAAGIDAKSVEAELWRVFA